MQKKLIAAMVMLAVNNGANAADNEWLKFSGFGTLGVVHSSDKGADFRNNIEQTSGAGLSNKLDSGVDSVFGAQADVQIAPELTGTAQIVTRRMSDYNSTKPAFEWANLKYQVTRDLFVRGGRIVAPMFMISESRMVGYSQTAVRPIGEVYLINPITYLNGADIGYRFEAGPVLYKIGAAAGNLSQEITSGAVKSNYRFKNKLINASAEYKGSTVRVGYARLNTDVKSDTLSAYDAALATLVANNVPNAATVQDNTTHTNLKIDFYNLGYVYDRNEWLVQAEYGARKIDKDSIVDMDGFWLLGGYRIGKWMPYVSWSHMAHKSAISFPTVDTSSLGANSAAAKTYAAVSNNFMQRFDRTNIGAGVRWDIIENVALKAQVERIDKGPGGTSYFVNGTSEFFANERKVNVYSATLDFVF